MNCAKVQRTCRFKAPCGFTLVESLLSIMILSLMAAGMTGLYYSGLQAMEAQSVQALLDSQLRSRMERLISTKFDQLADGSETVTVDGTDYNVSWTVVNVDLDGDATPEPSAKQIGVTLGDRSLTTIVVDDNGRVGKI